MKHPFWTLGVALVLPIFVIPNAGCGGSGNQPGASGGSVGVGSGGSPSDGTASGGIEGTGALAGTGGTATGGAGSGGAVSSGGVSTGGGSASGGDSSSGGMGTGGEPGSGGTGTGGSGPGGTGSGGTTSSLAEEYPCDGSTDGYDVVLTGNDDDWTVSGTGDLQNVSTGMGDALVEAYSRLSGSADDKATLLVQGDGTISASAQITMPGYMVLNICGTIDVAGTPSGSDRSPLHARNRTHIDIPHATITGNAQYGMFFRDVSNLHLGDIHINGTAGHGIRIDSHGSDDRNNARGITIDYLHAENTGGDGIEIYGAVDIEIGTVVARRTGACGLILNDSIDADIGLVDAVDAAWNEQGYAAFRTANRNGRYDDGSYPTNIRLRELRASGSDAGRGFFCVSQSGGVEIEQFTIDGLAGDPAIFIENCYNVTLASASGSGSLVGGRGYIGHNSGNGEAARDVLFQNITLSGGAQIESNGATCGRNNRAVNVTGGSVDVCE